MATKAKAKASTKAEKAKEIRLPSKLPVIKGMTPKQVMALYKEERSAHKAANGQIVEGLGHVRVMARLTRRARGEQVIPIENLRRYTNPLEQTQAKAS